MKIFEKTSKTTDFGPIYPFLGKTQNWHFYPFQKILEKSQKCWYWIQKWPNYPILDI